MLNYLKSEFYRTVRSDEIHGTLIGLLFLVLLMNVTLGLMKNVEHFRYGITSFSYSMIVSVPMLYCYVASAVAVMLYESDRRRGTLGNSIACGFSRIQLLAGKCIACLVTSLVLLAIVLPVYIGSAVLLLNPAGPTMVQDMLWEIPAMSLITIASQILAVILLELFEKDSYSILVWLTVMLFLPKLFLMGGMILPFGSGPIMDIAMWMPANFLTAGTRVTMSECVTLWSSAEGMARCLVSGAAGILIFSGAGVFLLRKKDLS